MDFFASAVSDLAWAPETFWNATPQEYWAVVDWKSGETAKRRKVEEYTAWATEVDKADRKRRGLG